MGQLRGKWLFTLLFGLSVSQFAFGESKFVRWTLKEDANADIEHVVQVLAAKTGFNLDANQFRTRESRELATSNYLSLAQMSAGVPIAGMRIRLWTDKNTGSLIQAEAQVEDTNTQADRLRRYKSLDLSAAGRQSRFTGAQTMTLARRIVNRHPDDKQVKNVTWEDTWTEGRLVRRIHVKARRGEHRIDVDFRTREVVAQSYREFPQADQTAEFSVPALVYPIYEQPENASQVLPRKHVQLKYLKSQIARSETDPYAGLRGMRYFDPMHDPFLGESEAGREMGYWSMNWVRRQADGIRNGLPLVENSFTTGGVALEGRYATISLHAAVPNAFTGLEFAPQYSAQFRPDWKESEFEGAPAWEMIPSGSLRGRPLMSAEDALNRPARIHPEHDPVTYINDGFDEIQVYYAVNAMFDALRPMGFTDPDLAERPFHAFLYDPDIGMRDNAYYTDDTINFTTYSPGHQNFARDNPTIWHELGHGVMDRMMGRELNLADTGGLSEGMADFVAQLVVQAESGGESFPGASDFRIINNTGFFLTNEVHDDGEAYGGAMNDLLVAAIRTHGRAGLAKVTDLVLESMRLTRDHPHLTAMDWFEHMLFADELGREGVRAPGELRSLIVAAIEGRNFPLTGGAVADFKIRNITRNEDLTDVGAGSRENPIRVSLGAAEEARYDLSVQLKSTATYQFRYPVTVKVQLNGGPLQGAVHWAEEDEYPRTVTINSDEEAAQFTLAGTATCDFVNQEDGSCKDFAYVQVFNSGDSKPVAKKRFYLRIRPSI